MAIPVIDTFALFVDGLADRLDDHEATTDDLAAGAFVSRFHFDRIVSAAAGETPARLRRRVLLERAAFRLVTSGDGVLEIAQEAGYSSNEAFTRAFRRAYGVARSHGARGPAASSSQRRTASTSIHPAGFGCPPETR